MGRNEKEVGTGLMRNGGRPWKPTVHFRERGSLHLPAALRDPVMQVWGKRGLSGESTQVETIRGIVGAESSWQRLGGGCWGWGGWGPHQHNCSRLLLLFDMAVK